MFLSWYVVKGGMLKHGRAFFIVSLKDEENPEVKAFRIDNEATYPEEIELIL